MELKQAKELLLGSGFTCVFKKGDDVITATKRGVAPLLEILETRGSTEGYVAADRVVGKAAAMIYVLLGVREVFALIMSEPARCVFEMYGIPVSYGELVPMIKNRSEDGFCPMEQATRDAKSPEEALALIKAKLSELNGK